MEKGDLDHLEAMDKMRELMKDPDKMNEWFKNKKKNLTNFTKINT